MDYYSNADGWKNSAKDLLTLGHYQQAVYSCCVAVELYLKSRLLIVPHETSLENSHDVINIYNALSVAYGKNIPIEAAMPKIRKYFNESRYPSNPSIIFNHELADKFLSYVHEVKKYVDTQCIATQEDLLNKFNKKN